MRIVIHNLNIITQEDTKSNMVGPVWAVYPGVTTIQ